MHDTLPSVCRDELTPLVFLERTVRVFPDKTAVVYGDMRRTWAEFAEDVGRFAGALVRAGVAPGDRVAVARAERARAARGALRGAARARRRSSRSTRA